jgi:tetratricopeptide (TPR) repeat protein
MGALEDLARLQTHLAWQTLQFLVPDEAPSDQEFQKRQPVYRVEAIENFIRGVVAVQPDLKLKFFQQAVRIEPMYSQANYELGRLYLQRKNYRAAADTLSKVLPSDPHCREALFHLGLSRYNLNEFDAAQMAFLKVAEDVPLNEVFNNLGAAQTRSNPAEALKNFQKALEGDPNDPDYHFNVGYALLRSGRYGEAAERFRSVLDRVPGDPVATTLLGRCIKGSSSRASGGVPENLERLKGNFEETAYRQLKAVLEVKK